MFSLIGELEPFFGTVFENFFGKTKNNLGTLLKNLVITFKKQPENRKNPLKTRRPVQKFVLHG
jgi:hypothetical protein